MAGLPRGTVTLLYVDVEGSTRLVRQLGDGYGPMNRPSPTDHVANQLNRRQLYGGY